jgi:MFS family permease
MIQTQSQKIDYQLMFALAALDAGILISWVAYHNFQPKLLEHFHFGHLSSFLSIAQAMVMLSIPLIAGYLTDYYRRKHGSGFSVFAIGITSASMIFMAVAFTISDQTFVNLVGLLPVLIVFWLISMNIFHSPANSILESLTTNPYFPLMMAFLTISKVIIHGVEPYLLSFLENEGGTFTFVLGGTILIVTGIWFTRATRKLSVEHNESHGQDNENFVNVIAAGLIAGLSNAMILHYYPDILAKKFSHSIFSNQPHLGFAILLGSTVITALTVTRIYRSTRVLPMLAVSLLSSFVIMLLILVSPYFPVTLLLTVLLGVAYGFVLMTAFPHALANISAVNATLGTGVFFASFEVFEVVFSFISHH